MARKEAAMSVIVRSSYMTLHDGIRQAKKEADIITSGTQPCTEATTRNAVCGAAVCPMCGMMLLLELVAEKSPDVTTHTHTNSPPPNPRF